MTDSFIVYRNPLEAAMWETLQGNPMVIVHTLAAFLIVLVLVVTGAWALEKLEKVVIIKPKMHNTLMRVIIVLSFVIGFFVAFFMLPII